jgi:hypothetical protein
MKVRDLCQTNVATSITGSRPDATFLFSPS